MAFGRSLNKVVLASFISDIVTGFNEAFHKIKCFTSIDLIKVMSEKYTKVQTFLKIVRKIVEMKR